MSEPPPFPDGLKRLFAYWRRLGEENFAQPYDPVKDFPDLSPNFMLVDVSQNGLDYRYFGEGFKRWLSVDLTGKPVGGSSIAGEVKLEWQRSLRTAATSRQPSVILIKGDGDTASFFLTLPLNNPDTPTKSILVALFFDPAAGPRIVIRGWKSLDLGTLQQVDG